MEFKHFFHLKHNLSFTEVSKENDSMRCILCLDVIHGPAYICNICKSSGDGELAMHKSCAEMPPQIQKHSFHPHPLRIIAADVVVCDRCAKLWGGALNYRCTKCTYDLDFKCALAISNDYELPNHEEGRRIKTTIPHFSHYHQLTRCKFSIMKTEVYGWSILRDLWGSEESKCMACKQELHGTLTYTCLPCRFVLHESCVNEMPRQVLHSLFHPQHILLPRPIRKGSSHTCTACWKKVKGISFYCNQCDVNLHASCAKYRTRAIRHSCHPHYLLHLGKSIMSEVSCNACDEDCGESFFSCIKCEFNIHVQCIPLPPSVQRKCHLHPLMLVNPFVEDDSGNYYCDTCDRKRNPEHHVYYCGECTFVAHIGCALFEVKH